MRVEEAAPVFVRGGPRFRAEGIVTSPLGYPRDELRPGEQLPGLTPGSLPEALTWCDEVVLSFHGKLGDTLLAFGAVSAVLKYLLLVRPEQLPTIRLAGPHASLFGHVDMLDPFDVSEIETAPRTARTVVVGDRWGTADPMEEGGGRVLATLTCDPEYPPCWSSGSDAYPALPARYFLTVERLLGVRLDEGGSFMPILHVPAARCSSESVAELNVGVVTATSWPMRKDYGLPRFLEALRQLARDHGREVRALLVPGREADADAESTQYLAGVAVDVLRDAHYSLAAEHLAACDLVVGNDTGLTHLAAAARRADGTGPQVIGLYARHSHAKWRTGLPWHHALATPFSEKMHREDRCPVRDMIDDRLSGAAARIGSIIPRRIAEAASEVLVHPAEVRR